MKDLSRPMAKKLLTSLKAILKDSQRRAWVAQNVALPVTIRTEKRHRRKIEVGVDVPTRDEVELLLEHADRHWPALIATVAFTGLRASELRGLTWENLDFDNLDFDNRVIRVRQRADRWHTIGATKSHAGDRDVPMVERVEKTLREWRLACPPGPLDLVFPSGAGNVESHSNIYRRGLGEACLSARLVDKDGRQMYSSTRCGTSLRPG